MNLLELKKIHQRFKPDSPLLKAESDLIDLNEAFDIRHIQKAFSFTNSVVNNPLFSLYFERGFTANVSVLYIDICSFSTRFQDLNDDDIVGFLDRYYEIVIPIIYEYGGEIDKIMGDGIIAVFGPPFLEEYGYNEQAVFQCSKKLIRNTSNTDFVSKIAIHNGEIRYYKNNSFFYNEYTMIGKLMT